MDRVCDECSLKHREMASGEKKLCGEDARAEMQLKTWLASSFSRIYSFHA